MKDPDGPGLARSRRNYGQRTCRLEVGIEGSGRGNTIASSNKGARMAKEGGRRFESDNRLGSPFGFADVPFEFVGKVASPGAMAEARDIKGGSTSTRHDMLSVMFSNASVSGLSTM